jgi:predicted RNA-binding Zn-ribbon protein involved in translation (DUF1610 family)
MSQSETQSFVCPECGGTVGGSPRTRDALLESGCPLCTTPFEPTDLDP